MVSPPSYPVILTKPADELIARRWRQIAKIDRGAVTAYGVDPHSLLRSVETGDRAVPCDSNLGCALP
jgi:hypothetical protein